MVRASLLSNCWEDVYASTKMVLMSTGRVSKKRFGGISFKWVFRYCETLPQYCNFKKQQLYFVALLWDSNRPISPSSKTAMDRKAVQIIYVGWTNYALEMVDLDRELTWDKLDNDNHETWTRMPTTAGAGQGLCKSDQVLSVTAM